MSPHADDRTHADRGGRVATLPPKRIDGALLRRLFADAGELLHRHVPALNAINVFPVPDGDTGTNMHLTLRAGVEGMARHESDSVSEAAQALAHGALMGARGNSGVILSQVLRGFAKGLEGEHEADGAALARALASAREAAYGALSEPVEGTILTVVRETAEALEKDAPGLPDEALTRTADAARQAVERTPELLPVLKAAGVVDAGGLGFAVIVEGLARSIRGETLDVDLAPQQEVVEEWRSDAAWFHEEHKGETGYCTEFVVSGRELDPEATRQRLEQLGTSLLVVGEGDLLRVHLHTSTPDDALAYGRTLGDVGQVKVDNMEAQIQRFVSETPEEPVTASIGVVAVAAGEGIEMAFKGVGVAHLVQGGQTMNPSAGDILEAIDACEDSDVVVLPNNKNIIAAAEQAAQHSSKRVTVVPSRSIPQGIAAVLALNSDLPYEENVEAMWDALSSVRSAEVTRAVRSTTVEGKRVDVGQAIGIIDGSLEVIADDVAVAAERCVEAMRSEQAGLLTLYAGEDVRAEDAGALEARLRERFPDLEVDLVEGGQPHYPYIISLE